MNFYRLEKRDLRTDWGDYGDILAYGMTQHLDRVDGLLQLERTGPFIPPIAIGFDNIVTEKTKTLIESSGLTGTSFRPVIKARIVRLPWEEWKRSKEPQTYPESGEPEDYILERPHDQSAADEIGNAFELVVERSARIERLPNPRWPGQVTIHLIPESWTGSDFFGAAGVRYTYVTERAKVWLEERFSEYINFVPTEPMEHAPPIEPRRRQNSWLLFGKWLLWQFYYKRRL